MTEKNMTIELLYFADCPSWKKALDNLDVSLHKFGISQEVSIIPVETQQEAVQNEFTGSPMKSITPSNVICLALLPEELHPHSRSPAGAITGLTPGPCLRPWTIT